MAERKTPSEISQLTDEELVARLNFMDLECPSRIWILLAQEKDKLMFLQRHISGNRIIDLGCGAEREQEWGILDDKIRLPHKMAGDLFGMGATEYVGVDPYQVYNSKEDNIEFVRSEALTYLRAQEDNSGVILASSLFSEPLGCPSSLEEKEYLDRIMREMYRVTPNICFGFGLRPDAWESAKATGFDILYRDFDVEIPFDGISEEDSRLIEISKEDYEKLSPHDQFVYHCILMRAKNFYILKKNASIESSTKNLQQAIRKIV